MQALKAHVATIDMKTCAAKVRPLKADRATSCSVRVRHTVQGSLQNVDRGLVAWGGIEPPTRGFSICVIPCFRELRRVERCEPLL